jgi:hypothetical protein
LILFLLLALAAKSGHANVILNYPPSIGFSQDEETTGPCGGFTPDFSGSDAVTDFHVDGDVMAATAWNLDEANILYRATLDSTGRHDWVQLLPVVAASGAGSWNFCEPAVAVPGAWVGQRGVVGTVADAGGMLMYQVRDDSPFVSPVLVH